MLTRLQVQPTSSGSSAEGRARPLTTLLFQSITITSLFGAAIGYGVMTLLMTATPISMHVHNGFSLGETKGVIQAHLIAMFLPSFFTGRLVARFSGKPMLLIGIVANMLAVVAAVHGQTLTHFTIALVLLGIGWNLLYIASTTLLSKSCRPAERYRVQATNDFAVFSFQTFASLGARFLVILVGWERLALSLAAPLDGFLALLAVYWLRANRMDKVSPA
jgi:MFS family permease